LDLVKGAPPLVPSEMCTLFSIIFEANIRARWACVDPEVTWGFWTRT